MKGLDKKERKEIFALFLVNSKLKFSEIEKQLKIRSNMVAYHLDCMIKEGFLIKEGDYYRLTKQAEKMLPLIPNITGETQSPLPVILVAVMNEDKILLMKRNRRPYKGYWGLIGGKMLHGESFNEGGLRLVKHRTHLEGDFVSMNAALHERVKGDEMIKHSFILFFTKVNVSSKDFWRSERGELRWFDIKELDKVIPSDLWLIKNRLDSNIAIESACMDEDKGELSGFRII